MSTVKVHMFLHGGRLFFLTATIWPYSKSERFWGGWNIFWGRLRGVRLKRISERFNEHFHPRPWFLFFHSLPPRLLVRTNETSIFWRRGTSHWRRFWRTLMSTQTSKGWAWVSACVFQIGRIVCVAPGFSRGGQNQKRICVDQLKTAS